MAWRLLDQLTTGAILLNPEPEHYAAAEGLVHRYPDQMITMFDAVVAVLGEQLGVPVWTYDADFEIVRANVWR